MTGYQRGIKVGDIRLAPLLDYNLVAQTLDCERKPTELRCKKHAAVWIHDRCMVANAIANRMGSKILQMEHRITELSNRPTAADMMAAKQEAHKEGFMEAMNALTRNEGCSRAYVRLKKYWKDNYGSLKTGLRES